MSYKPESPPASGRRERSSIAFPYGDLDSAVNVARTIYTRAGGQCGLDQLAAWLDYKSVDSGTFRLHVSTARIFGFLTTSRNALELTDLGARVADTGRERQARVEAFLSVPLYRKTFDEFRGQSLPPDAGLESAFARMGVAAKQTNKARQAFQRSALQAGFFDAGKDRLVEPVMPAPEKRVRPSSEADTEPPPPAPVPSAAEVEPEPWRHPFIQGLISTLPAPGTPWSDTERKEWLTAAEHIFALIYKAERPALMPPQPDPVEQATA